MTILALDPGKTVGYVKLNGFKSPSQYDIEPGECDITALWDLLEEIKPSVIISESFQLRKVQKVDLAPVEGIGVIKEWARQNKVEISWQTAQQVKHFFTDERLKEQGAYKSGLPHANDATRHLFYWLMFGEGKEGGWLTKVNPSLST